MNCIRHIFEPIQPTIKPTMEEVAYQEFWPDQKLSNHIYCYWHLKTMVSLEKSFYYRVVADGCLDIFFELNAPSNSFVMGFCKQYTDFELPANFNYVGVRFLPTMLPQLFKVNASELSNKVIELALILPKLANFIALNFNQSLVDQQIILRLDHYFLNLIAKVNFNWDHRLYEAIDLIFRHQGIISIEKDLNTGISPRQLRRLFQFYIGDTPKTFSKVVRFQSLLNAKPSTQSLKHNKLFYDAYYDQSHFIKEFKTFYGLSPTEALK